MSTKKAATYKEVAAAQFGLLFGLVKTKTKIVSAKFQFS